jgi:hypothetical protein
MLIPYGVISLINPAADLFQAYKFDDQPAALLA